MKTNRHLMKDVQGSLDFRNMPIQKVGIRNIRYPITVRDKSRETQQTVANVSLSGESPALRTAATHMSRFIEVLDRFKNEVSYQSPRPHPHRDQEGAEGRGVPHRARLPVLPEKEGARSRGWNRSCPTSA